MSRFISLAIALAEVIAALFLTSRTGAAIVVGVVLFGLACIWFSDEMGSYGALMFPGRSPGFHSIEETPGPLVFVAGWIVLFSPIALKTIVVLVKK